MPLESYGTSRRSSGILLRIRLPSMAFLFFTQLIACASSRPPLPLAPHVDLEAVQGGWYIVATIPNRFERGMVAPFDFYSLRTNGDLDEDFHVRFGGFDAKLRHQEVRDTMVPGTNNASWRVHIFWPISVPFLVLYTDPAYRYVVRGELPVAGLDFLAHPDYR